MAANNSSQNSCVLSNKDFFNITLITAGLLLKIPRKPVALEPMNPYERRVIHSALQNDRYVCTKSEGEEPYRKVVIMLKRDR